MHAARGPLRWPRVRVPPDAELAGLRGARAGDAPRGFGERDPEKAQYGMAVEDYAKVLAELKPRFIHHPGPRSASRASCARRVATCDQTYFDVRACDPRPATTTCRSGIAYAFHPHRDCWYSAPFCQINWWIPIYAIRPDNVMAFHPRYWSQPVRERVARLQLRGVEPHQPPQRGAVHQGGHADPAQARGADGARPADPSHRAARRAS